MNFIYRVYNCNGHAGPTRRFESLIIFFYIKKTNELINAYLNCICLL